MENGGEAVSTERHQSSDSEDSQLPKRTDEQKSTSGYVIAKLRITKDNEKILEAARITRQVPSNNSR